MTIRDRIAYLVVITVMGIVVGAVMAALRPSGRPNSLISVVNHAIEIGYLCQARGIPLEKCQQDLWAAK